MSSPPKKKHKKIELCKVSGVIFKGFFGINMTPIYYLPMQRLNDKKNKTSRLAQ